MSATGNFKFRQKLFRLASSRIAFLILLSVIVFIASQFAIIMASNESNARQHLSELKSSLLMLDDMTLDYLMDDSTKSAAVAVIHDPASKDSILSSFRRFTLSCPVMNNIIVSDAQGYMLYTSFGDSEFSSYLDNYNRAICHHAAEESEGSVYRAVYFDIGNYADRMTVLPIYENGELTGFISLFLSGSSWNYYLSNSVHDGVITDLRHNIIYMSRHGVSDSMNRFVSADHGIVTKNGLRFWVVSETLPEQSAQIYSLVYYPQGSTIAIILLFLLIICIVWLVAALTISKIMAQYNAKSIEKFIRQLDTIKLSDPASRITWEDDDEFRQVAEHTNGMLDTIYELNDRNTELIQLNNRIEREQLTAQMNPHFLYNTLEIIRNLAFYDSTRAEEIISCLTKVLRYSADTSESEVLLSKDMDYVNSYLEIQKCRFGSRFEFNMDIDEACMSCFVPKLFLQPLIENSIKYGFKNRMDLSVNITGKVSGNTLIFHVSDNGGGMPEERAAELQQNLIDHDKSSPSIGLRNLSRRLYLKYGNEAGIRISNVEGQGLDVIVTLAQIKEAPNV